MSRSRSTAITIVCTSIFAAPGFAWGGGHGGVGLASAHVGLGRFIRPLVQLDRTEAIVRRDQRRLDALVAEPGRRPVLVTPAVAALAPGLVRFGAPFGRSGFFPIHRALWRFGHGCGPGWGWGFGCYGAFGIVGVTPPPVYYPPSYCLAEPEDCHYPQQPIDNPGH